MVSLDGPPTTAAPIATAAMACEKTEGIARLRGLASGAARVARRRRQGRAAVHHDDPRAGAGEQDRGRPPVADAVPGRARTRHDRDFSREPPAVRYVEAALSLCHGSGFYQTVGVQGPAADVASPAPGHGGIVTPSTVKAPWPSARN